MSTIYNREEAARRAEAAKTATPGTCQMWTRNIFGANSVGDHDGDGDADAVDGWKHSTHKHPGDRNPPRGTPVSFSGGSRGYGHRAVSLGNGKIRSTDMSSTGYRSGYVGTTTIAQIEKSMGVSYLGWSEDISGQVIPMPPQPAKPTPTKPEPAKKTSRGAVADRSLEEAKRLEKVLTQAHKKAKEGSPREKQLDLTVKRAVLLRKSIEKLPFIK